MIRDQAEIFLAGQTTAIPLAQLIKIMDLQNDDTMETLILVIGTNDVSRNPVTPEVKWELLLVCVLNELKEKYRSRLVVLCTIPLSLDAGSSIAEFINGIETRWIEMVRKLIAEIPDELKVMDFENALQMVDHRALTRSGTHFNTQQGKHWIKKSKKIFDIGNFKQLFNFLVFGSSDNYPTLSFSNLGNCK